MAEEKYYDPLSDMSRIKESLVELFGDIEDISNLIMPSLDDERYTWMENWLGGNYTETIDGKTNIINLIGHCFDIPYVEGTISDNRCAIFMETHLLKVENQHIKQVGLDIFVVCHKDAVRLSKDEKEYYNSIGIYGNRVDSAIQVINSTINDKELMKGIKEKYSIGELTFVERNPLKQYIPATKFYGKCLSYTYQSFYQRKDKTR